MEEHPYDKLQSELKVAIANGHQVLDKLSCFGEIKGVPKLQKKIQQEIKFLEQFMFTNGPSRKKLKEEHLKCSNLHHLEAIVQTLQDSNNPVAVLQGFEFKPLMVDATICTTSKKLIVDVISDRGAVWNKAIAKNPKAINLNATGGQQFGQRSILQQVEEYVSCAKQNPYLFTAPKVNFIFCQGVSCSVANKVEKRGANVIGSIVKLNNNNPDEQSDDDESGILDQQLVQIVANSCESKSESLSMDQSTLNLDITAMIAYVSALTNGQTNYVFKEPILTDQAKRERDNPVKPHLDTIFKDKRLICCESALKDFKTIVDTLGGPGEKTRASELLERRLHAVVPDVISDRIKKLELSGQIKARSIAIFGTGDALKVSTVSANEGFVRAAQGQGVHLAVLIHESRALTESKMKVAVPCSDSG